MEHEYKHIVSKLDELLEITHRIEKKDIKQDGKITALEIDVKELNPLKKQAAQLTGAIRLLILLGIGATSGIVIRIFLL